MKVDFARAAVAAAALTLAGCAASPYYVSPSQKALLPQKGPAQKLGEASFLPDDVVFETPVGFRRAARLGDPVKIEIIGKDFEFESGDVLVAATITGASSALVPASAFTMCGTPNANVLKTALAASTLGITSLLNRTGAVSQVCLVDGDLDGKVEKAILAGVKSKEDAAPVALTPAGYELIENEPMGGESRARIFYRGKTGLIGGHISFDLAVEENGQKLLFDNVRTKVSIEKLPQTVTLMGTVFTVKSYDPADGRVVLDIAQGFQEGNYGITTTTRTTYIPIYVPR